MVKYSAAAYLSFHAGKRVPLVESNIVRFYGRFFGFNMGPEFRREKRLREIANRTADSRSNRRVFKS